MSVLRFFLFFLLTPVFSYAQLVVDGIDLNQREDLHFIEVNPTGAPFSRNVRVFVDYGQRAPQVENANLLNEMGEKIDFNSIVHVLNYFTDKGWEVWKMMPISGEYSHDESNRISIFFRRKQAEN